MLRALHGNNMQQKSTEAMHCSWFCFASDVVDVTKVRAQLGVNQSGSWLALRRRDDMLVAFWYPPGDVVRVAFCCGSPSSFGP